jgi:hypothetical protein
MSYNKNMSYKNGVINTNKHPTLLLGQVVRIIKEDENNFFVKLNYNSNIEVIDKKFVVTN